MFTGMSDSEFHTIAGDFVWSIGHYIQISLLLLLILLNVPSIVSNISVTHLNGSDIYAIKVFYPSYSNYSNQTSRGLVYTESFELEPSDNISTDVMVTGYITSNYDIVNDTLTEHNTSTMVSNETVLPIKKIRSHYNASDVSRYNGSQTSRVILQNMSDYLHSNSIPINGINKSENGLKKRELENGDVNDTHSAPSVSATDHKLPPDFGTGHINKLENEIGGTTDILEHKIKSHQILANRVLSGKAGVAPENRNPPTNLKRVLKKYVTQAKSPLFSEFFVWNEKCMAVPFTQRVVVEESELREALALNKNINMASKDYWVCTSVNVVNQFCFGVCRSFRYPLEDGSDYSVKAKASAETSLKKQRSEKSVRDMIKYMKKSYDSGERGLYPQLAQSGNGQNLNAARILASGGAGIGIRSRRSLGFFCSACVPKMAKHYDVRLRCYPRRDVTDQDFIEKESGRFGRVEDDPNNIMLFFLNRFGITPNMNNQSLNVSQERGIEHDNKIPKIIPSPDPMRVGPYHANLEKSVSVIKRILIVEACDCQPCSSHDKFL